jgi:hypothetical protein
VFAAQPFEDPAPGVGAEVFEGGAGHAGPEVGAPAPKHPVQMEQQDLERLVRAGEQLTPGAPWRIRLTDDIRALFVDDAPEGWLATLEATLAYGVSRQTLLQRVKRGELQAVHVRTGRRKGLRIQPPKPQDGLF